MIIKDAKTINFIPIILKYFLCFSVPFQLSELIIGAFRILYF